jgi:hypothetical protein
MPAMVVCILWEFSVEMSTLMTDSPWARRHRGAVRLGYYPIVTPATGRRKNNPAAADRPLRVGSICFRRPLTAGVTIRYHPRYDGTAGQAEYNNNGGGDAAAAAAVAWAWKSLLRAPVYFMKIIPTEIHRAVHE